MVAVLYLVYSLALFWLVLWGLRLWREQWTMAVVATVPPLLGLVFDTVVNGLGASFGPGPLLQALNALRYLIHVLLTPLWVLAGADLAGRAGVAWLQFKTGRRAVVGMILAVVGLGFALLGVEQRLRQYEGV